jgi:hypothetical protein
MDRTFILIEDPTRGPLLARALTEALGEPILFLAPSQRPPAFPCDFLIAAELPGRCGLDLGFTLQQSSASYRILLWSPSPPDLYLWTAWRLGFAGYLDCADPWTENLRWLQAFRETGEAWPPPLRARVERFETAVGSRLRQLRPEEAERLADLARPISWKERACRWGISREGARRAAQRLCKKLGCEGPEDVVAWAWTYGLLKATSEGPIPTPALQLVLRVFSRPDSRGPSGHPKSAGEADRARAGGAPSTAF